MKKDDRCRSCHWYEGAYCQLEPPQFITETYSMQKYNPQGYADGFTTQYTNAWTQPPVKQDGRCRHHKFSASKFAQFIGREMAK